MNRKITFSKPRKDLTVLILVLKVLERMTCQKEIQVANKRTNSPTCISVESLFTGGKKWGRAKIMNNPDSLHKVLERNFLSSGLSPPRHFIVSVLFCGPPTAH